MCASRSGHRKWRASFARWYPTFFSKLLRLMPPDAAYRSPIARGARVRIVAAGVARVRDVSTRSGGLQIGGKLSLLAFDGRDAVARQAQRPRCREAVGSQYRREVPA